MLDRSSIIPYLRPMNTLSIDKRVQIIKLLVEGNSLRAASLMLIFLADVGRACQQFHNTHVIV